MIKIAHVSDLHLTGHNFIKSWSENLQQLLREADPDFLVITGDLTDEGYVYEYEKVAYYLEDLKISPMLVVPGNHDARNEGYRVFEEFFGTRYPFFEDKRVIFLGVDSTEPDIDDGHVGRENYPLIREKLGGNQERFKFLFLHHHLLPIPGTGRERNIPVDAGDVLKICQEVGIDFVLSGHKHLPHVWCLEGAYFVTAGTATSHRLKGFSFPSFNLLMIGEETAELKIVDVKDRRVRLTYQLALKTKNTLKQGGYR